MHERRSDERKRAELYAVNPSCIENKKPKQKKNENLTAIILSEDYADIL